MCECIFFYNYTNEKVVIAGYITFPNKIILVLKNNGAYYYAISSFDFKEDKVVVDDLHFSSFIYDSKLWLKQDIVDIKKWRKKNGRKYMYSNYKIELPVISTVYTTIDMDMSTFCDQKEVTLRFFLPDFGPCMNYALTVAEKKYAHTLINHTGDLLDGIREQMYYAKLT